MSNIMNMPNGTKLRHKRTGTIYELQGYVNEHARLLMNKKYLFSQSADYINENTQEDYEVTE